MKKTNKRSKALVIAQAKYEKKRAGGQRLPASYLSEQEAVIFNNALKITGKSKKDTIIEGLLLIDQVRNCDTCKNQDCMTLLRYSFCINCIDFNNWELKK